AHEATAQTASGFFGNTGKEEVHEAAPTPNKNFFLDDLVRRYEMARPRRTPPIPESSEKSSANWLAKRPASGAAGTVRGSTQIWPNSNAKKPASKSYFNLRSLLGLDAISGWYLLAFFTICLLVHGATRNDYFSVTDFVSRHSGNQRCLLSAEDFNHGDVEGRRYAYTARPVLIKNVPGLLQDLYDSKPDSYKVQDDAGQFYRLQNRVRTLREGALHMSEERRQKDWYFAGATPTKRSGRKLRQYYSRPDFLPSTMCPSLVASADQGPQKSGRWCLRRSARERLSLLHITVHRRRQYSTSTPTAGTAFHATRAITYIGPIFSSHNWFLSTTELMKLH
uniref:PKD_channel domain-containing protein n=1 Tax=Macrostomum lignano TaxID=282301 RepID=A0A1I8FGM8_9PLAT